MEKRKKSSLVHGIWFAIAVTSFVVGSQYFPGGGKGAQSEANRKGGEGSGKSLRASAGSRRAGSEAGSRAGLAFGERSGGGRGINGRVVTLSGQEVEALGEQFRTSASPIERRLAFSRLLEGLTGENAELVREQIAHLPAQSAEFREFHYAWGAVAGADAIMFGADTPKADMAPALAGWASADPAAALRWFHGLDMTNDARFDNLLRDRKVPPEELRNHLAGGLVQGLADADPNAASRFVTELAEAGHKGAGGLMQVVTGAVLRTNSLGEAAQWSEGLPEGQLRNSAMGRVAGHFAGTDPEGAAEWAATFSDRPEGSTVIQAVGGKWAWSQPEAAVGWLESLPASEGRTRAMNHAFGAWAGRNPEVAGEYITAMPPSPERDSAISGFANRLVHEDPATGVQWAASVSDPQAREMTMMRTGQVYYRRDPEGAREWLANSGLSAEAQQQVVNPPRRDWRERK